jgi:hypothetical protein
LSLARFEKVVALIFAGVAQRQQEINSYEVAGNTPDKFTRPERTTDSAVPPGRNHFGTADPAQCAGLISIVAPRQKPAFHLWLKTISNFSAAFPRFE